MQTAEGSLNDSEAVTRGIRIAVRSRYVPERSRPMMNEFFFAYTIRISNEGRERVQLMSRAWLIEDAEGHVEEVRGPGVVGEQPVLAPGEAFEYRSGTPLATPSGIMVGTYEMETRGGEVFEVAIPAFSLDSPHQAVRLN